MWTSITTPASNARVGTKCPIWPYKLYLTAVNAGYWGIPLGGGSARKGNIGGTSAMSRSATSGRRPALRHKLRGHRVRLVTLNNTVNANLFLNVNPTVRVTNPTMLLNCNITKVVTFLVVHRLNRVIIRRPMSNSFTRFTCGC